MAFRTAAMALPALMLTTACAEPSSYMGVSLSPGAADPAVQSLAERARSGESARAGHSVGMAAQKAAQLELGIRYEEGNGLPVDLKRARKLYRAAAAPSGGATYVYVFATQKGGQGLCDTNRFGIEGGGGYKIFDAARRAALIT